MPRASSSVVAPARFNAVRCPATACSADLPCTCTPRTRTRCPLGKTSNSSSLRMVPETSVPVTTVPKPFMVKTRSMGRRAMALESFAGTSPATFTSSRFKSSMPAPVSELTATMGLGADPRKTRAESPALRRARLPAFPIDGIGLGQHRDAAAHRKQPADIEVFASLRLDRFVGRDHQQHQIDPAHSRQHVAHEALVPGHIDEPEPQSVAAGHGQFKIGKADVDGDAAPLFFLKPVGVNAGERLDQRGLAVVDVAGGADDDGLHLEQYSFVLQRP